MGIYQANSKVMPYLKQKIDGGYYHGEKVLSSFLNPGTPLVNYQNMFVDSSATYNDESITINGQSYHRFDGIIQLNVDTNKIQNGIQINLSTTNYLQVVSYNIGDSTLVGYGSAYGAYTISEVSNPLRIFSNQMNQYFELCKIESIRGYTIYAQWTNEGIQFKTIDYNNSPKENMTGYSSTGISTMVIIPSITAF